MHTPSFITLCGCISIFWLQIHWIVIQQNFIIHLKVFTFKLLSIQIQMHWVHQWSKRNIHRGDIPFIFFKQLTINNGIKGKGTVPCLTVVIDVLTSMGLKLHLWIVNALMLSMDTADCIPNPTSVSGMLRGSSLSINTPHRLGDCLNKLSSVCCYFSGPSDPQHFQCKLFSEEVRRTTSQRHLPKAPSHTTSTHSVHFPVWSFIKTWDIKH